MSNPGDRLLVKRIYDPAEAADGQRVLVDRLWPRGITKERAALSLWLKDIAPSNELRNWFHSDRQQWQEFQRRYRAELDANGESVQQLLDLMASGRVTLLYAANDAERNHAVVLADYITGVGRTGRR
jgi:uncharacterized protein YeaO (DUF488 family)